MRVTNMSIYNTIKLRLGILTSDLKKTNDVVSTGKRINNISDDPIGLTQVLDMNSTLDSLEQYKRNIGTGKSWLQGGETSLSSIKGQIAYSKQICLQQANASISSNERNDAVDVIDTSLRQIFDLANTRINNSYIYAGTENTTIPFAFDNDANPTKVTYSGNETDFSIQTDDSVTVAIGKSGNEVFNQDFVIVNETNNKIDFIENSQYKTTGKDITDVSAGGALTTSNVTVTIDDYTALTAVTPSPAKSKPLRLTYDGTSTWTVSNNPGYNLPGDITGTSSKVNLDFDNDQVTDVTIDLKNTPAVAKDYVEFDITPTKRILSATIDDGKYSTTTLATAIKNEMEEVSKAYGYTVTYDVSYDSTSKKFSIKDDGSSSGFLSFELLQTSPTAPVSKIKGINTGGGISDASITVQDPDVLSVSTPYPPGTKPMKATYNGNNQWVISNNPGYDNMPTLVTGTSTKLELDVGGSDTADIIITLDTAAEKDGWVSFDILSDLGKSSIIPDIDVTASSSYTPLTSDSNVDFINKITVNDTNNKLDFREYNTVDSGYLDLTATITNKDYTTGAELATEIETQLEAQSTASGYNVEYEVTYNTTTSKFSIIGNDKTGGTKINRIDMLWITGDHKSTSIASTIKFTADDTVSLYSTSDNAVSGPITIDDKCNKINFVEVSTLQKSSGELTATIANGTYTDLDTLATAVKTALEAESKASGLTVTYSVSFDAATQKFNIKADGVVANDIYFLWETGKNSQAGADTTAATVLGFNKTADDSVEYPISDSEVVQINISDTNNKIDFKEVTSSTTQSKVAELTANIATGQYTSFSSLATAIETAMEDESKAKGNTVDYTVSYDPATRKFTIKEKGEKLSELVLLWSSGTNTAKSAAQTLGFDKTDDSITAISSSNKVEWGIFKTLIDLKSYLKNNDVGGIQRSTSRLNAHFGHIGSVQSDTGLKYDRLDIRENIIINLDVNLTASRSNIEDADFVNAVMDLQNNQLAYEAALKASAQIMKLSLMDYV